MNSVITLVSDYGSGSIYSASLIGSAHSMLPDIKVVEISNQVPTYDLSQAALLLKCVYQDFPKGSWHLICVETSIHLYKQILVVEENGHFFVALDNGVFSYLFSEFPKKILKVSNHLIDPYDLFPEKTIFLKLVTEYFNKGNINGLTEPSQINNIKIGTSPIVDTNSIKGVVLMIDGYQNVITNILKEDFENARKGRPFRLYYWGKHMINKVSRNFEDGKEGDDLILFNHLDYLVIAINKGKGSQLLNLKPGSIINVEFEDEQADLLI